MKKLLALLLLSLPMLGQQTPPPFLLFANSANPTAVSSTLTTGQTQTAPPAFLAKCMNGTLVVDCNFTGGGAGATLPFPGIVFATSASGGRIATGIDEAIAAATPGDLSNVFMGTVAAPKPGNDNVALGNQACQSLNFGATTAATNALGNVCIGWHAGQSLTTGNFNILIGNQAGIALTGTGNPVDDTIIIAIGAGALQNAVSTSPASGEGVFIGEDAGSGILHTGFDVVIGNHALTPQNGTTNENVVLGINAMATDGGSGYTISDDVIIGREAATGAQSNSANVIIGQTAGIAVTTPVSDVIIGQAAAPNYTTGGSNVVVGQDAAPNMTTGSANVAIGQEAAFSLTNGAGNVGIGQFSMTDHGNANIEMGSFSGGGSASSNNVAIGSGAGNGMTGGNNTSVGISAHNAGASGNGTENLLLGHNAQINQNISNAVQIGAGTNAVSSTAQIFSTQILNAAGKIPSANLDVAPLPVNNPIFTGTLDGPTSLVGISNLTYYPAACGSLATAPSWCAGSEMGAWVNAAYAAGTSPVNISIDPGAYSFTTPIVFGTSTKYATVQWNNAILTYTPTTGTALTIKSGGGATAFSSIYNMQLRTAVSAATTTGVVVGDGTTNADYTRIINPSISGFKTLLADNSYGLEVDNPNFQPCSSAASSVGISIATSGDDLKVLGGTVDSCVTNIAHTNGNAIALIQTVLGGISSNDVAVTGGGVLYANSVHYVNPSGATAHYITNNGLYSDNSPHYENDAATGSSATPIVNTGTYNSNNGFNFSAGQTYTNLISTTGISWNGLYGGFVQDFNGRISSAYNLSTRGDRQISLTNPDFEGSNVIPPPGWITVGTTVVPAYETSTQAPNKTQSLKFTAASQFAGLEYLTSFSVVPGDTYSLQCALKSDGTSTPACVVQFQTTTGGFVSNLANQTSSTSWVTLTSSAAVPATAVKAVIFLQNNTAAGAGTSFFDQVSIQKSNFPAVTGGTYSTATNCSSTASPAVCGSAAAGSILIPTGTTSSTLTVNTTAVTANSQIFFEPDDSLGTRLSTTCNSTLATLAGGHFVSARSAGTSFTITFNGSILTNGVCGSYHIIN